MKMLGARIRSRRKQLGLTQSELCLRTDSTQKQIWLYESGKGMPSVDKLTALAKTLKTTTDWLLGLSDIVLNDDGLSQDENHLVEMYRSKAPPEQQKLLEIAKVV